MARQEWRVSFRVLWLVLGLMSISAVQIVECRCSAKESRALLKLKGEDLSNALSSWKQGSDCCHGWAGVTCDVKAMHVIVLNLTGPLQLSGGEMSTSICNLQQLQVVNISMATAFGISDTFDIPGQIPVCIWNLTAMQYFRIATIDGSVPRVSLPQQICKLKNLTHLDISALDGTVDVLINTNIPDCLWEMRQLEYLDLGNTSVSQSFSSKVCHLKSLSHLAAAGAAEGFNFAYSNIYIPACIWNLTRLEYLSLNGFLTPSLITADVCNLANLAYLDIDGILYGDIPACIWMQTKLEHFRLYASADQWQPNLQLRVWYSSDICNLKNLTYLSTTWTVGGGFIPTCIWNLTKLEVLELPDQSLTGSYSPHMCNSPKLRSLSISDNSITGALPACIWDMTQLEDLSLADLELSNMEIPTEVFAPSLGFLDLSWTNLNKAFLNSIGNLSALESLSLGGNNITILSDGIQNLSELYYLDLEDNNLEKIPLPLGSLGLEEIHLGYNRIRGIPPNMLSFSKLSYLYLMDNLLEEVPVPLSSSVTVLSGLYLSRNHIKSIPPQMLNSSNLIGLDLSSNPLEDISNLCQLRQLLVLQLTNVGLGTFDMEIVLPCLRNLGQSVFLGPLEQQHHRRPFNPNILE